MSPVSLWQGCYSYLPLIPASPSDLGERHNPFLSPGIEVFTRGWVSR